jgi:MFS family permease
VGGARAHVLVAGEAAGVAALRHRWVVLAVLLAAPFLAVLDGFVVTLAVPSIQDQLHATDAAVQLVIAGYVVLYAAFLITGGRLGDLHGRRGLLVAGLALFSLASAVCAAAPDQDVLVVARCVQGASAALAYPQTLALLRVHYRGRHWAVAMAAFGAVLGLASVAAQLVGGVLIQADVLGLGWRAIFLAGLPVSVVACALALLLVPESRAVGAPGLDRAGVVLVTVGLVALVGPLILGRQLAWPAWTWPLLGVAAVAGAAFVLHERSLVRRGRSPLVSLELFRLRPVVLGLVTTLVFYAGQISFFLVLSLYLQHGLGLAPLTAGLVIAPVAIGFLAASTVVPRLGPGRRRAVLTAGATGLAASAAALCGLILFEGGRAALPAMLALLFLGGSGFGLVIPTLVSTVLQLVPRDHEGAASGVLVTAQQVAGALGVALSGVLFFGVLHRAGPPPYGLAFAVVLGYDVALFMATAVLVQFLGGDEVG